MGQITLHARTGSKGALHIDVASSELPADADVEVVVRPVDPAERYGLKTSLPLPPSEPLVVCEGDPVEYQRELRAQWGEVSFSIQTSSSIG